MWQSASLCATFFVSRGGGAHAPPPPAQPSAPRDGLAQVHDYITEHFKGDCLIAVGDEELIKIHYHTNEPWLVLEYAASLGDIYDVVVENMQRQEDGKKG